MSDTKDLKALKLPKWEKGTKVEDFDNLLTASAATRGKATWVIDGGFKKKLEEANRSENPVTLSSGEAKLIQDENERFFNNFLVSIGNKRLMSTIRNSKSPYFPTGCGRTVYLNVKKKIMEIEDGTYMDLIEEFDELTFQQNYPQIHVERFKDVSKMLREKYSVIRTEEAIAS